MSSAPRAGWYRDPAGTPDRFRWWDGTAWTDDLSDAASAPPPGVSAAPVPYELDAADGMDGPRRPRSTVRRVVAAVLIVALFASAGLGIGVLFWGTPAGGDTQRPAAPAASSDSNGGELDSSTRTATIESASMTLPGDPYAVRPDPMAIKELFGAAFAAEAMVHADYAEDEDWSSLVTLASLDPAVFSGGDLEVGAQAALVRLSGRLYAGAHSSISDIEIADHAVDGHPGVRVTSRVHYAIAGLPSRYDDVTAIFVRLDDGTIVAALSSVPNDATPAVRTQAQQSLDTLRVR